MTTVADLTPTNDINATVKPPGTSHPKVTRAELEAWLESGE